MLSPAHTAAISSGKTGIPISTLPYWYFTASCIVLTFDIDTQHNIGRNMVPYFITFSTVMLDVFPTGVLTAIFEVLFILYKIIIVPELYRR